MAFLELCGFVRTDGAEGEYLSIDEAKIDKVGAARLGRPRAPSPARADADSRRRRRLATHAKAVFLSAGTELQAAMTNPFFGAL